MTKDWQSYIKGNWENFITGRAEGHPITEDDLKNIGIWQKADQLKSMFYQNDQRSDCTLIQGGAFVINGRAYLLLGMSTIDILETLSQHKEVEGVIGTGNSLYVSNSCDMVYSTLDETETITRYEVHKTGHPLKVLLKAKVAPLIILNRTFRDESLYAEIKQSKQLDIIVDLGSNCYTAPERFAGTRKARLRSKFVKTARTGHCVINPTLTEKELLFDREEKVTQLINGFNGSFGLGYMLWSELFANSVGMVSNYKLGLKDNPSEIIGYALIKYVEEFEKNNPDLYK